MCVCLLLRRETDEGSITSMVWDLAGREAEFPLIFSTVMGRLAALPRQWTFPAEGDLGSANGLLLGEVCSDPLAEDSLLMEVSMWAYCIFSFCECCQSTIPSLAMIVSLSY